jgi:capsular exopolysaccharide synthesis family protein
VELRDYLRILRKGWPVVLTFVVLGLAAGIGLTATTSKVYQANVQIFVATSAGATASELSAGNTFTSDRVQSYTSIATSPEVTAVVAQRLRLNIPVGGRIGTRDQPTTADKARGTDLADHISADAPQNKVLINLHVTDHSPQQAALLANAVAAQFNAVVESTEQTGANGRPVVKLTVIHPATAPGAPIKPNKSTNIGLGFALGLLLGLGVIVLRDVLDNTIKGPQDFAALDVPVLGVVPFDKRTTKSPVAFRVDPHSARAEAYRQLRTNMQFIDVDNPPRIIAVTSAVSGEGKTTIAINLAVALAETGVRVCLIGADLRKPTLADALGLIGDVGLTTVLIGKAPLESVLQSAGPNLLVLTSGPVPPNPSELLVSGHARDIIQHIASQVDFTIIDSAPLLPVTDGAEVAALADATLIVARAGKTTRDQAARSVEALAKVGERPVGVILNMVSRGRNGFEYGGYYYEQYRPDRDGDAGSSLFDERPPPAGPSTAVRPPARPAPTPSPGSAPVARPVGPSRRS